MTVQRLPSRQDYVNGERNKISSAYSGYISNPVPCYYWRTLVYYSHFTDLKGNVRYYHKIMRLIDI